MTEDRRSGGRSFLKQMCVAALPYHLDCTALADYLLKSHAYGYTRIRAISPPRKLSSFLNCNSCTKRRVKKDQIQPLQLLHHSLHGKILSTLFSLSPFQAFLQENGKMKLRHKEKKRLDTTESDRESSEHPTGTAFGDAVTAAVCSLSSVKFYQTRLMKNR
ncbi:hypothetical protein MA16_Dca007667 [Dendrobium catenatum]|uniref:Uncharacterized protein n=1 Tax=Dendrobium catenatum TaxID=906689 RepID=A0A2I0X0X7_9ASPA|nr:hypothetical protein MA16_Dca007667 [Dendrobium catenatum]